MTTLTDESDTLDPSEHANMNLTNALKQPTQSHVDEVIDYVAHHFDANETSLYEGNSGTTLSKATPLDTVQGELDRVRRSDTARRAAPNNLTNRSDQRFLYNR